MHWSTAGKVNGAFALVLGIQLFYSVSSYWSARDLGASALNVTQGYQMLAQTQTLVATVKDAEAGQRGYLLTGSERYLDQYREAVNAMPPIERDLMRLTTGKVQQQNLLLQLKPLIDSLLAQSAAAIRSHDSGRRDEALALLRSGGESDLMNRVRALVGEMQADQFVRAGRRNARQQEGIHEMLVGIALANGLAFGFAGLAMYLLRRDLNRRQRAETTLTESEKQYRLLAERCTDLITQVSRDGCVQYASPSCRQILGYDPGEMVGQNLRKLIHHDDFEALQISRFLDAVDNATEILQYRMLRKDGTFVFMETSSRAISASSGAPLNAILQVGRDISRRQQYEAMLKEREEEFRTLFEDAPLAYHEIDCHGVVQRVNRAECRLLGLEPEHLVGKPVWNLISPAEREISRLAVFAKLSGNSELRPLSRPYVRSDGTTLTLEIHENLIRNAAGEIVGIRSALIDITDRKLGESLERGYRDVLEAIVQNQTLKLVLRSLAALMERHDSETRYSILLLREGALRRGAAPSLPLDYITAIERTPIGPISGSCGAAAYWAKEIVAADVDTDPLWAELRDVARIHGVRACASVPIFSGDGKVLGTLAACSGVARKPAPEDLRRMEYAARLASVAIEHRQLADQLAFQARHDTLTGLPNRLLFEDRLKQSLAQSERHNSKFALLFLDLNGFKLINDELGHAAGDAVLKRVADRLQSIVRRSDTVARIGGDEFTIILDRLSAREDALQVSQKIARAFEEPLDLNGRLEVVTPSIGIGFYPDDGRDAGALQRSADTAMYRAKDQGRKRALLR